MREPLVIAVAQPLSVSYDVAGNAERHAETVRAADARVVVFPELSLTGYELDAETLTATDPRLDPLAAACRETGTLALAGAPVAVEGNDAETNIAMLAFDETGTRVAYAKIWLGESEATRFVAGDIPGLLEVDGWRLGLAICKDTGVPQHAEEVAALGVDIYVAGVLELATDTEVQPARARRVAFDQNLWVAIASFAGSTGGGFDQAAGGSGVWRRDGTLASQVGPEVGAIARAIVS
jgi:predicted amidohydrolase